MPRRNDDDEGWNWIAFWAAIGLALLLLLVLFMIGAWFVHLMEDSQTGF